MPLSPSAILTGLNRVLSSAKVHTAAATCAGMWVAAHYASPAIEPSQRAWLWLGFMGGCVVTVREVIAGWAAEDAAKASAPPASPAVQVNTGADATNAQQSSAAPPATSLPNQPPASPQTLSGLVQPPPAYRPRTIPPRSPAP